MSWRRLQRLDIKSDYRIITHREVLDNNLWPCAQCGDRTGRRSHSWSNNIRRGDLRVYRRGQMFHYLLKSTLELGGQTDYIGTRCRRYITFPNETQLAEIRISIQETADMEKNK